MYVPEMPGAVTKNEISLSPVVASQSQIGQGQSPLTCLAYNISMCTHYPHFQDEIL